jgi:hypothetical protein
MANLKLSDVAGVNRTVHGFSLRVISQPTPNLCARTTPVTELKLTIANATNATAVFPAGIDLARFRKSITSTPGEIWFLPCRVRYQSVSAPDAIKHAKTLTSRLH